MDLKPVIVANPHPLVGDGRKYSYVTFLKGETLGDYLARTGFDVGRGPKSVYLNGERVPDDKWHLLLPGTGDQIVIRTRATGGNGGKVLRVVAMVALTIVSAGYGAALGGALGFTGTTAAAVGSSLIMIGGSVLIGALLPPPKASLTGNKEKEQSPTYGISAGRNSYNSYGPMIVVFGKHKVVPYFATKPYTTFSGNDQFLSQAFHFGLQPDLDLQAIRIGNTDITNYRDVEINRSTYDGKLTLVAGNLDTVDGFELANVDGWTQRTTPRDTQHISVDVAANLYSIADDGDEESVTVQFEAQYKAVASAEWLPMGGYYETRASHYWSCGRWTTEDSIFGGKKVWQQVQYGSINPNEHTENEPLEICHDRFVPMKGKVRTCETYFWRFVPYGMLPWQGRGPDPITGHTGTGISQLSGSDSQKPARMTLEVGVATGEYDVRFRKISQDLTSSRSSNKLTIAQIRCTQTDNADYSGQCRMAVRIKATSQLNGAVDSLSAIASAKTLVWQNNSWVQAYTSNPAWWYLFWARGMRDQDFNRLYGECLPESKIDLEAIKSWAAWCDAKGLTFNWVLDRKMSIDDVYHVIARAGRASKSMHGGKLSVIWDSADIPESNFVTPENIVAGSFEYKFINTEVTDEIIVNFFNQEKDYEADVVRQKVPGAVQVNNPVTFDLEGCTVADQAGREANLMAASQYFHRQQFSWEMDIEGATITRGDVVRMTHDLTSWGASGRIMAYENGQLTLDSYVEPIENAWMSIRSPNNKIANVRVSPVAGSDGDKVVIVGGWPIDAGGNDLIPQPNNDEIDYIWQYNPTATPGRKVQIKSVRPSGRRNVKFEAIEYSREYHESEDNAYIHIPTGNGTKALINVFGITASERIVDEVTGRVEVTFTWVLSEKSDSDVHLYVNGEPFDSFGTPRYMTTITAVQGDIIDIEVRPTNENRGVPERYQYTVNGTLFQIPAIQALTTASEVYGILLNWTIPPVNYIQRTEIWYSEQSTLNTAQKLADIAYPQQEYRQSGIRAGQGYYYWVRLVDRFGNIGPFYPTQTGVYGVSSTDVNEYIEVFKDEFLSSVVGQQLQEDIEIITGGSTTPGSIAHVVEQAREDLQTEIATAKGQLEDSISNVDGRVSNVRDDLQGKIDDTNTQVTGALDDILAVTNRTGILENGLSGLTQWTQDTFQQVGGLITGINTSIDQNTADIVSAKDAIDQEIIDRQNSVTAVQTTVEDHIHNEFGPFQADTQSQLQTLADADIALVSKQSSLEAKTNINPNLLGNGGFELDFAGWTDANSAFEIKSDPVFGKFLAPRSSSLNNGLTRSFVSATYPAKGGQIYTLSCDAFLKDATAGAISILLRCLKDGVWISSATLAVNNSKPAFSENDAWRYQNSIQFTLPADANEFNVFVQKGAGIRNATDGGVRRIKVESGSTPTPYTAEGTSVLAGARITEADALRVSGDQALALRIDETQADFGNMQGTVQDLAQTVSENDTATATRIGLVEAKTNINPNLLYNGGFESGLDGWNSGVYEVVDHPVFGRYAGLRSEMLNDGIIRQLRSSTYPAVGGKEYTLSCDVFMAGATTGNVQVILRSLESGSWISSQTYNLSPGERPEFVIGDEWRFDKKVTFTLPANANQFNVYVQKTAAVTNATAIGVRLVKVEAGPVATPYTADSSLAVTSAAVKTQQQAITDLETRKAEATDVTQLNSRMDGAESTLVSQGQTLVDLENNKAEASDMTAIKAQLTGGSNSGDLGQISQGLIYQVNQALVQQGLAFAQQISALSANTEDSFNPLQLWDFTADFEGWTPQGGTLEKTALGMKLIPTNANNGVISPAMSFKGADYSTVKLRVRRLAGVGWDGTVFYTVASGHGFSTSYCKTIEQPDFSAGGWVNLIFDMSSLSAGGNDWVDSTIATVRIDLGSTTADQFDIDWIGVGNSSPAASLAQLENVRTTLSSQLQTYAADVTTLQSRMNDAESSITVMQTALNDSVNGSIANRLVVLETDYSDNKASVSNSLIAISDDVSAITQVANEAKSKSDSNEASISDISNTVTDVDSALSSFKSAIEAKTNNNPNLHYNGGFENGLDGWGSAGNGDGLNAYELIDDSEFGRCLSLKSGYFTGGGNGQVAMGPIVPAVGGQTYTVSCDMVGNSSTSPNPFKFIVRALNGSSWLNATSITVVGRPNFDAENSWRFENSTTITLNANANGLRVFIQLDGIITDVTAFKVRQIKVEAGTTATPYTADKSLSNAHSRITETNAALIDTQQSFAQQVTQVRSDFDGQIAGVEETVETLSNDHSALATRTNNLEAKTNTTANLLANGGFELGLSGWTDVNNGFEIRNDSVFGLWAAVKNGNVNDGVEHTLRSATYPGQGGQAYTMSFDARSGIGTGGKLRVILRALNNGSWIESREFTLDPGVKLVFDVTDSWRYANAVKFTLPATANQFNVYIIKQAGLTNAYNMGVRRIKVEAGDVASAYSADSTLPVATAAIAAGQKVLSDGVEAVATSVSNLRTDFNSNKVVVDSSISGLADEDQALGQSIESLRTSVNDSLTEIRNDSTAISNDLEALASTVSSVSVEASRKRTYRQNTAPTNPKEGDLWINTASGQNMEQKYYTGAGWVANTDPRTAQNKAAITAETNARVNADEALAEQYEQLEATVVDPVTGVAAAHTKITQETAARVQDSNAAGLRLNKLESDVGDNAAAIQQESQTRADAISAMASDVSTVQAGVGEAIASAQANSEAIVDADGRMSATIMQKVQILANGQRVFAGTGLGIESTPDGEGFQSSYNVWADRFAVWSGSGTELFSPFVVSNSQVFINDAVVGQLSADKITAGTYNVGKDGYGCVRSIGKYWADGTSGFFFERLDTGVTAIDFTAGPNHIWMGGGSSIAQIDFRGPNKNRGFYADQDGYMQINEANVINRLNLAGQSVSTISVFAGDNIYLGEGTDGNTPQWAAQVGNSEAGNALVIYSFMPTNLMQTLESTGRIFSSFVMSGGTTFRCAGQILAGYNNEAGSLHVTMARQMWLPAWTDVTVYGSMFGGNVNMSVRVAVIFIYK